MNDKKKKRELTNEEIDENIFEMNILMRQSRLSSLD